jgi:hypothetical protein
MLQTLMSIMFWTCVQIPGLCEQNHLQLDTSEMCVNDRKCNIKNNNVIHHLHQVSCQTLFYKSLFIQAVLERNEAVVVAFSKYLTNESCTRNFQQRKCKLNNEVKTSGCNKSLSDKVHYKILHTSSELSQDFNPESKC